MSRALASPIVHHQARVESAYGQRQFPVPKSPPKSALDHAPNMASTLPRSIKAVSASPLKPLTGTTPPPFSLFDRETVSPAVVQLARLAPETLENVPEKYPASMIRHAMAAGFSVREIIATLYVILYAWV